jgi:hypothetical protein
MKSLLFILALFSIIPLPSTAEVRRPASVSTMLTSELADFDKQPVEVQTLIRSALGLTEQKLTYVFGSHDPRRGGMDCSGAIYYLLTQAGLNETPRQSDQICEWLMKKGLFRRTAQADTLNHPELATLRPGDLLFWSGTYNTTRRKTPVTHVMLYLGKNETTGKPIIFGASDGRRYEGQKRTGVSLFDFVLPKESSKANFYGFGPVPGLVKQASKKRLLLIPFFRRVNTEN